MLNRNQHLPRISARRDGSSIRFVKTCDKQTRLAKAYLKQRILYCFIDRDFPDFYRKWAEGLADSIVEELVNETEREVKKRRLKLGCEELDTYIARALLEKARDYYVEIRETKIGNTTYVSEIPSDKCKQLLVQKRKAIHAIMFSYLRNERGQNVRSAEDLIAPTEDVVKIIEDGEVELLRHVVGPIDVIVKVNGILALGSVGYKTAIITLEELYSHLDFEDKEKLDIIRSLSPKLLKTKIHIIKPEFDYSLEAVEAAVEENGTVSLVKDEKEIIKYMKLHNKGKARILWWVDKEGNRHRVKSRRVKIPVKRIHTMRTGELTVYAKVPITEVKEKDGAKEVVDRHREIELFRLKVTFHGHYGKYPSVLLKLMKAIAHEIRKKVSKDQSYALYYNELTKYVNKVSTRNWMAVELEVNGKKLESPTYTLVLQAEKLLRRKFRADMESILESPRVKYWWYMHYKVRKEPVIFGNQAILIVPVKVYRRLKKRAKGGKTVKNVNRIEVLWHNKPLNHVIIVDKPVKVKILFFDEYNVWAINEPAHVIIYSRHHPENYATKALTKTGEVLLFIHRDPDLNISVKRIVDYVLWM